MFAAAPLILCADAATALGSRSCTLFRQICQVPVDTAVEDFQRLGRQFPVVHTPARERREIHRGRPRGLDRFGFNSFYDRLGCLGRWRNWRCCRRLFRGQKRLDRSQQIVGFNRFGEILVHPGVKAQLAIAFDRVGGQGDDLAVLGTTGSGSRPCESHGWPRIRRGSASGNPSA